MSQTFIASLTRSHTRPQLDDWLLSALRNPLFLAEATKWSLGLWPTSDMRHVIVFQDIYCKARAFTHQNTSRGLVVEKFLPLGAGDEMVGRTGYDVTVRPKVILLHHTNP